MNESEIAIKLLCVDATKAELVNKLFISKS
jgi:hypothetical protein